MDPRYQQQQQNRRVFFSSQNEQMLYSMLTNNFQQRLGSQLNEKQTSHLERGVEFYMSEVFQANPMAPVQTLNKEVLSATSSDFIEYLQRQELASNATPQMFQDASQRFDQMQQDRQKTVESSRPSVPDYVQPIPLKEDDSVSAISLFEEAKNRRNMEIHSQAELELAKRSASSAAPIYAQVESRPDPRSLFDKPLDMVVAGRADENMTLARSGTSSAPRGSLPQDILIKQEDVQSYKEVEYNLSIYSADRKWESPLVTDENRFNFSVNLYSGNSTNGLSIMPKGTARFRNIVRIEFVKAVIPIEVTEMIVRKVANLGNNLDPLTALSVAQVTATTNVVAGTSPITDLTSVANAYNILRNYENIVGSAGYNIVGSPVLTPPYISPPINFTYDTTLLKNIFAYPFVTLNVAELDTNTYGTNNSMDNAFGILQYDSNWTDNTNSLGFTSLIPKHMKCQRIYSPTPLATLNKLSIRLQQPNGMLVSSTSDTLDISGITLSMQNAMAIYFNNTVDIGGTPFYDTNAGEYIFIDCKQWFNRYQFSVGDRLQVRNLTSSNTSPAMIDLLNYIQRSEGHTIVGTAYTQYISATQIAAVSAALYGTNLDGTPKYTINVPAIPGTNSTSVHYTLNDGCNSLGYSRFLIIRGKVIDPTQGQYMNQSLQIAQVNPYGGATDNSTLSGVTNTIVPGRLINLSRQTQYIFRIITREYDSTSTVRPDNL